MRPLRCLLAALAAALALPAAAAAREVAIFYYPWFATAANNGKFRHWAVGHRVPPYALASNFYPLRGLYSSADPRVLDEQMSEIAAAGVSEVVSSWWGWGSPEDLRLPAVLAAARAHGLRVGIHVEPYRDRTLASVRDDLEHLQTLGITDFYVYRPADFTAADWATVNASFQGIRVFAQTPFAGFAAAGGFTGLYTYDVLTYGGNAFTRICAEAHAAHLLCAPSVGPGYVARRATGDLRVKPRRDGRTYDSMWSAAIAADADLVTITSYNEWAEGTQIEPARPTRHGFLGYDGAYGMKGRAAADAYLERTAYWVKRYVSL